MQKLMFESRDDGTSNKERVLFSGSHHDEQVAMTSEVQMEREGSTPERLNRSTEEVTLAGMDNEQQYHEEYLTSTPYSSAKRHNSSSVISTQRRPQLKWSKFSRSKVAQQVKDPLAELAKPSEHSIQQDTKRRLREHIEERNDGFLINQNPILGDRYEYKLKLLQNHIDLAQQGKLTYEPFSNADMQTSNDSQSINQLIEMANGGVFTDERTRESEMMIDEQYLHTGGTKRDYISNSILDTSVLVKSSQIHPEREKYIQLLQKLQRDETAENRLGVPIPRLRQLGKTDHHKKNLKEMRNAFRKKHTIQPYSHSELKKTPFEKLDEETKVQFELSKLVPAQKAAYENIQDERLEKKYGEPYDVAANIFKDFETKDFRARRLRDDLTGQRVMFHKKLDVMNEEFDTYVGSLVADLIFRQYTLRQQTRKNLERVDANSVTQHTQVLIEDLKRTEHLVYVDTAMNLPEDEH